MTVLNTKLQDLDEKNKALEADKEQLTKTVADDEAKVADLTQKLTTAATPAGTDATGAPVAPAAPPPPRNVPPGESNQLGTIAIHDGMTYQNAHLLKVDQDGITIKSPYGITKLNFPILPIDLQMRFGFDPMKGDKLPKDKVMAAEQTRRMAGD